MGTVTLAIAVSLDGYAAGPAGDLSELHRWMFHPSARFGPSAEALAAFDHSGAVIMGHRTYQAGQGPWGDEDVFAMPAFVLTHRPGPPVARNGTTFTFVDGIEPALGLAREAAGDRTVTVMGGADVARQYLRSGRLDEVRLHLVPVVLGAGTRLFDEGGPVLRLTPVRVSQTPLVTHLTYRV